MTSTMPPRRPTPQPMPLLWRVVLVAACMGLLTTCAADEADIKAHLGQVELVAGGGHTCARAKGGKVRCWGRGAHGQIGHGKNSDALVPETVVALPAVARLTAARDRVCALGSDRKVRCWGRNDQGQLGDGSTQDKAGPTVVVGVDDAVDLAACGTSTCALDGEGAIRCWGGQLAASTIAGDDDAWHPTTLPLPAGAAARLVGGHCAIAKVGALWCWAHPVGHPGDLAAKAVEVSGLADALVVARSGAAACAIDGAGGVHCWGDNTFGQLGDGSRKARATPAPVPGLVDAETLVAGDGFFCAGLANGAVRCWGRNQWAQLGDGTTTDRAAPVTVQGLSGVRALASGDDHVCAASGAKVRCWGSNLDGRLGQGSSGQDPVRTPSRTVGIQFAKSITAGGSQTCAIGGGQVWCWGHGTHLPTALAELAGAVEVAAGEHHVCAVMDDGSVRCLGANGSGQVGNGSIGGSQLAASTVAGLSGAVGIAAGGAHSCAITGSGEVWCWGAGASGQLGQGGTSSAAAPVKVVDVTGAVALALGDAHSCALLGNGSVSCWGAGESGELGHRPGQSSGGGPAKVPGVPPAKTISAAKRHTCVVSQGGEVWCWGFNSDGQLGNVPGSNRVPPGRVAGVTGAVDVTAGAWHGCALRAGGTLSCWGDNGYGQLGNGQTADAASPVEVPGLSDVTAADAGGGHQCAIRADGSVWCWGLNVAGSVGDGSAFSTVPAVVAGALP